MFDDLRGTLDKYKMDVADKMQKVMIQVGVTQDKLKTNAEQLLDVKAAQAEYARKFDEVKFYFESVARKSEELNANAQSIALQIKGETQTAVQRVDDKMAQVDDLVEAQLRPE